MQVKLPMSYVDQLNGECWTFYKYSILNTSLTSKEWLATHFEFYINENMCGGYGDSNGEHYRMRYYSDILSIKRISVSETLEESIVDVICSELEKKHYIVLYVNFNRLRTEQGMSLHELMIYGYDRDKKVFFCPLVSKGGFKENEISFSLMQKAYSDARDLFLQDGWQLLSKRYYYFGITSLKIRDDYQNENWVADYIDKIDHEIQGKRITQIEERAQESIERTIYTGNACLNGLSSFLEKFTIDELMPENVAWRLIRTLKMMHDYRILFSNSIEWFIQTVNGQNNIALLNILSEYKKCADSVQRCYLLLCKYMQTKDIHLVESIKNTLDELHQKEISILSDYRELIWPYYYEMNGVPMPPEDE